MLEATNKLRETSIKKLFISYLIPSVLGMLLMSINILVDGIFVSHGVGEEGLAGVNIAVPVFSIFLSISLWIGMGGATLYSISLGKNNYRKAQTIFSQSFTLAILIVGILSILSLWKETEIAYLFGANEHILPYVLEYLHIILVYGILFVFENILSIFVRNDGNPRLAMIGLMTTALTNILLNYIFIFILEMGVSGAAYATALSAGIGFLVLTLHFLKKDRVLKFVRFKFRYSIVTQILKIGFPSFIVESSAAILTMGYNISFMHFIGEVGVTSFAVVNYIHAMFIMLFFGVGAALQPLASFHYGAGLFKRLEGLLKLTVKTGFILGVAILLIGWLFSNQLAALFGVQTKEVIEFTVKGIALFFISYLFLGYNMVYVEYFQATRKIRLAVIIVLLRILLLMPMLWILPTLFEASGIWLAFPVSEAITASLIYLWNRKHKPVPQAINGKIEFANN